MPCAGLWRLLWAVLRRGNIGIATRAQNAVTGLQMAFATFLCFGLSPVMLSTVAKMPPAGRRTAHKRLEAAGEYRDKGGRAGGPGGHKKARPTPGRVAVVTA